MKKLFSLIVVLFSTYFFSQQSDGSFASGYISGFKKIAGVAPKTVPFNSTWQTMDLPAYDKENGVQIKSQSSPILFENGYKQGKIDGATQLNSMNKEDAKKK